jgi:hypothetical protein
VLIPFIVVSVLALVDLFLLIAMPKFYIKLGIPIYKRSIQLQEGSVKVLDKVKIFFSIFDKLVYKADSDLILFRTKFSYSTLYSIRFLSIIKGEVRLVDGRINIIQRMNLTTVYVIFLVIFTFITEKIKLIGYFVAVVVLIIGYIFHVIKNEEINNLSKYIEADS